MTLGQHRVYGPYFVCGGCAGVGGGMGMWALRHLVSCSGGIIGALALHTPLPVHAQCARIIRSATALVRGGRIRTDGIA